MEKFFKKETTEARENAARWFLHRYSTQPVFRFSFLFAVCAAAALFFDYAVQCMVFAHPAYDQSWFLYAASRILGGATLYGPRLTEVNPPLIIWFSVIPNLLASAIHISPTLALKIVVSALIFASAGWCTRTMRAGGLIASPWLLCLCFIAIAAAEVTLDSSIVAQREQLIAILVLPYLVYAVCRAKVHFGVAERMALGVAAGIGVCFKPQQVLIVICFELFWLAWSFDLHLLLRAELIAFAMAIVAYSLTVYFATPYITHMVPLLKETFWAYGEDSTRALLRGFLSRDRLIVAMLAWVAVRRYLRYPVAPLALLAASFGAALAFFVQHTNWSNHFFPSRVFLFCAVGWMAIDLLSALSSVKLPVGTVAGITFFLVAAFLPAFLAQGMRANSEPWGGVYVANALAQYPPGTTVYVFTTGLAEFDDVYKDHLIWGSRYAHLWMIPAIAQSEAGLAGGPVPRKLLTPDQVHQLAATQRSDTAEDLALYKPSVVIVEHCIPPVQCQALVDINFDMLGWFLRSPAFAAEWSHYHLKSGDGRYQIYTRDR